jgi:O-acetyl-ADP-ribose deacetylase (regulator of RNase III)
LGSPRSLGGSEIEREAMALAPFELGEAVVTGAPGLEAPPIRAVIHAVVQPMLGVPARVDAVRRVVPAILAAAERQRLRELAFPLLGVEATATPEAAAPHVGALVDELVGCLRRGVARLDRVVIVCRFDDHRELVAAALVEARARAWVRTG